ncbi:PREDICTED: 39S ribosomal protein L12, mitochondrial [Nanorana parkeri]|uniref:39S ribosomal protein L12, mitochondrial n=1 Tax=Nanorana parkeri TaxID=125878 RepID=UPI0008547E3C|nr:PREDICTED: 39S ribosomal protein L12, mitochondrial [Nanorana parkeri]
MYPAARCCLRARRIAHGLCRLEAPAVRYLRTSCALRNQPLPMPDLDDAVKHYPPKIQQLVDQIASLTLLEVSDLNELLKKTLKIQDVGMMPMGAMMAGAVSAAAPAQAVDEEAAPAKKEKTHFTVKLTEVNAVDKVKLIKEVKNCVSGVNLVQAKKMVESLPQEIRVNVAKEEAEKIKAALEAAGGKVVLE